MKKLFICLLVLIVLTGCGKKKEELVNNNTNNQQQEETMNDIDDNEIMDFDDEDNYYKKEDKIIESTLINCEDCVFAYFTDNKTWGDTLTDYTKDYSTLKNKKGEQLRRFLGFKLDSSNHIVNAYTCGIKDGKAFCLEGATDDHTYEYNVSILKQVYPSDECKYIAQGKTYTCTDGNLNADTRADGNVTVHYDENCHIFGERAVIACY